MRDAKLMYLQNQLFRTAGRGGFEALTQAVAKDGAMMVWLDTATDKKAHPNENFAREMMELFTLGLGNYTQADVTAAARAFTGWAYDRADYRYVFRPRQHDFGSKTYLGQTGDWNGEDIVHIAVTRPESARFVLAKLWSHFAYPVAPSDPVVDRPSACLRPGPRCRRRPAGHLPAPGVPSADRTSGGTGQAADRVPGRRGPDPRPRRLACSRGPRPSRQNGTAGAEAAPSTLARPLATALGQAPFNPPNVGGWGQNAYWLDTATAQLRLERPAPGRPGRPERHPVAAPEPDVSPAWPACWASTAGGRRRPRPSPRRPDDPRQLAALALAAPGVRARMTPGPRLRIDLTTAAVPTSTTPSRGRLPPVSQGSSSARARPEQPPGRWPSSLTRPWEGPAGAAPASTAAGQTAAAHWCSSPFTAATTVSIPWSPTPTPPTTRPGPPRLRVQPGPRPRRRARPQPEAPRPAVAVAEPASWPSCAASAIPNPNLSHFASMDIWQTANPTDGSGPGWLGRWLDATGDDPMRAISIGSTLPLLLRGNQASATAITAPRITLPGAPDFQADVRVPASPAGLRSDGSGGRW